MRKTIEDAVLSFGIPPHIKGFKYLCDAIELKINGMDAIVKGIYTTIAENNEDTVSKVERAIRHAITKIDMDAWVKFGAGGLKSSEVISTFALKIKRGDFSGK